jgi:hypothetical protein
LQLVDYHPGSVNFNLRKDQKHTAEGCIVG